MTPPIFYGTLSGLAPAANHLWQSSVFALAAAILTAFFRKNHARVRYGIWLVASLKFILPISALIAFGQYVSPLHSVIQQTTLYSVVEVAGEPFKASASPGLQLPSRSQRPTIQSALPNILFTIWSLGCFAAMGMWWTRWRRISSAKNAAVPIPYGSELRALRRLERIAGVRRPIEFLLSVSPLEPGIFGVSIRFSSGPPGYRRNFEVLMWTRFWLMKYGMYDDVTISRQRMRSLRVMLTPRAACLCGCAVGGCFV
jgi:hypothetical protein